VSRTGIAAGVGTGVAQERKVRGLTQRQLAERAHVSLSLLRKVEQGSVPASPAFTSAVARALGLGVAELLGQPYPRETAGDHRAFAALPALRHPGRRLPASRGADLPRRMCRRPTATGGRPLPHRGPPRTLGRADPGHLGQSAPQIRAGRRPSR
jgi:transcriptional regulator with XRE-family HTH domain